MRGRAAVVTIDHDPSAGSERWRPPGEDAPVWVAPILAVIGTALVVWVAPRVPLLHDLAAPIVQIGEGQVGAGQVGAGSSASVPVPRDAASMSSSVAGAVSSTTGLAPSAPANAPPTAATPSAIAAAEPLTPREPPSPPIGISSEPPPAEGRTPAATETVPAPVPVTPATARVAPAVTAPAVSVPASVAPVAAAPAPCLPVVAIPFAHDSTKPQLDGADAAVRPLVAWLAEHPGSTLSVEGHADTIGTEDYNIVLSFGRARAVVAWLARFGVGAERTAPRAAGITPPKNQPVGTSTNRLVILQIEGVEVCRATGDAAKSK